EVLHPASEEELFRNRDEEEGEQPSQNCVRQRRDVAVEVQKSERQSQCCGDRGVEDQLATADPQIGEPQSQVKAGSLQPTNREKTVDACIQQENFVEHREMGWPCRLKPAEIHC